MAFPTQRGGGGRYIILNDRLPGNERCSSTRIIKMKITLEVHINQNGGASFHGRRILWVYKSLEYKSYLYTV